MRRGIERTDGNRTRDCQGIATKGWAKSAIRAQNTDHTPRVRMDGCRHRWELHYYYYYYYYCLRYELLLIKDRAVVEMERGERRTSSLSNLGLVHLPVVHLVAFTRVNKT